MRIARTYYQEISDMPLYPSQEERDQVSVVSARDRIAEYLKKYPDGPEHEKMHKLYADVLARLVAHELYVAHFYLGREKIEAALSRVQFAIKKYQGSSRDVDALLLEGQILLSLQRPAEARAAFAEVVEHHHEDPKAKQAERYLENLSK
jgi:outer membrane protein assembly factor BamD